MQGFLLEEQEALYQADREPDVAHKNEWLGHAKVARDEAGKKHSV